MRVIDCNGRSSLTTWRWWGRLWGRCSLMLWLVALLERRSQMRWTNRSRWTLLFYINLSGCEYCLGRRGQSFQYWDQICVGWEANGWHFKPTNSFRTGHDSGDRLNHNVWPMIAKTSILGSVPDSLDRSLPHQLWGKAWSYNQWWVAFLTKGQMGLPSREHK